jgi:phage shock protein A
MPEDDESNIPVKTRIQHCRDQIQTWDNRAAMARQQGREDLAQQALEHKRKYEDKLARLEEFDLDES